MKEKISFTLKSIINQEGNQESIEEKGFGFKQVKDKEVILTLNNKIETTVYHIKKGGLEIIKKDNYHLSLYDNEEKKSILYVNKNEFVVNSFTNSILVNESEIQVNYSLFIDKINMGDFKIKLKYKIIN